MKENRNTRKHYLHANKKNGYFYSYVLFLCFFLISFITLLTARVSTTKKMFDMQEKEKVYLHVLYNIKKELPIYYECLLEDDTITYEKNYSYNNLIANVNYYPTYSEVSISFEDKVEYLTVYHDSDQYYIKKIVWK